MVKIRVSLSIAWCLATPQPYEQKTQNPFPTFTLFPLQLNQTIYFPSSYFLEFPPFSLVSCLSLPERLRGTACNKYIVSQCTLVPILFLFFTLFSFYFFYVHFQNGFSNCLQTVVQIKIKVVPVVEFSTQCSM